MKLKSFFNFTKNKSKSVSSSDNLVLIGTVKSTEQFNACLSEKFYYIPYSHLVPDHFSGKKDLYRIKYVSMYQSANLFKNDSGIKYLGTVESISVVKRYEISWLPKDSKALYILFKISDWQILDEPIKKSESGIYPFKLVTFGTYKASREIPELFLETPEDRELYRLLKRVATDVNFKNFEFGDFDFEDYNDTLIIRRSHKCYLQLPMEVIRELPLSGFETVKNALEE